MQEGLDLLGKVGDVRTDDDVGRRNLCLRPAFWYYRHVLNAELAHADRELLPHRRRWLNRDDSGNQRREREDVTAGAGPDVENSRFPANRWPDQVEQRFRSATL